MSHHPHAAPPDRARRAGLARILSTAGAVVALAAAVAATRPAPEALAGPAPAEQSNPDTLREPMVVRSRNGVLNVTLEVVRHTFLVPRRSGDTVAPETMSLRAYRVAAVNDTPRSYRPAFPGPTFRVRPGDRVRIKLVNKLGWTHADSVQNDSCQAYPATDATPPVDTFVNCFHGPNWTNIHYHGFHVTPHSRGDDVLLQIPPGGTHQYDFQIPHNQSPGTHWYHPHKHGSVAVQVLNGMSGAFIVEDPRRGLDSLTRAMGMKEHLIAIQQIDSQVNLIDQLGTTELPLVNGQQSPVVNMQPGEVQRWRIVNENIQLATNYALFFDTTVNTPPTMYDIARDGVAFAPGNYSRTVPDKSLLMSPGNRLDVFVKAPEREGTYFFRATRVGQAQARHFDRAPGARLRVGAAGDTTVILQDTALLVVNVRRRTGPYTRVLPARLPRLPSFLANLDTSRVGQQAVVVFSDGFRPGNPANPNTFFLGTATTPAMRLSDTVYIPRSAGNAALPMRLGRTQVWQVQNRSTRINHPFHIHINPFQVLKVVYPAGSADNNAALYAQLNAAADSGRPIWLDVVPLPKAVGSTAGSVTIVQRYDPFTACPACGGPPTGRFVMHCHILGHEERGMMQILEIFPASGPTRTSATPGNAAPAAAHGSHRH